MPISLQLPALESCRVCGCGAEVLFCGQRLCIDCADEQIDRICCWERTWYGVDHDPYRKFRPKTPAGFR